MNLARIAILIPLFYASTACKFYTVRQAIHQNNLYNSRKPVNEVIKEKDKSDAYAQKLLLVQDLLLYAEQSGLDAKNTYRYFIDTEGKPVSYLVQAAEATRFQFVTWWFPLVGSVPYLGFFSEEERNEKALELKNEGYDVNESEVTAFSGLGWFEDPIYSSMLDRSDPDIAQLFFHELTHRTIWVKNNVEFNENLAEFVSITLTQKYFTENNRSSDLTKYSKRHEDKLTFKLWLKELKKELEKLYTSNEEKDLKTSEDKEELLKNKSKIIGLYTRGEKKPKFDKVDYIKAREWNNASIMGASLYIPDMELFEEAFQCINPREMSVFLQKLALFTEEDDDPFTSLKRLCQETPYE